MQKTLVWRTETRKVDDLVPHAKNPRKLSEKQRKDLETSITKFNLVEIPAINTDNGVLAGHARLRIMQALGRGKEEIDVRVPNRKLTVKECEEYLLRSNKNTGSWDYDLLKAFDTEFLLDIGFDDDDLSNIWDDVLEIEDDEFNEEDEIEEAKKTDIINQPRKYLPLSHTSYSHFQKTIGWYPVVFVNCEEARTCSLGALLGWSVSFQHAHFA